nr:inner nuclear membrane protein Man1 [Leptinotarsa decemlineata]
MALKPELQKRAIANKCFDKTLKPHMTSSEIVNFCVSNYAIQDPMQIRSDLHNLEILIFNNPDWGIRVAQTENNNGLISEADIAKDMEQVIFHENDKITSLVIPYPDLPWKCTFYKTFHLALNSVLLVSLIFAALYLLNYVYKYYKHYQQKQKDEIGFMVEKIIDILQSSCGEEGGDPFLVINHVRDMILPIVDRQKKEKTWAKAVQFINENESRVRTEVQEVKGEPFEVWRWIGSANISMGGSPRNKSWQGQAFETQVGSVNSLPCSPTPCLKIRGMVEDGDRNMHIIREAVLSKCAHQCRILHCAVDTSSNCVYLKCADPNDAAIAYRNLHGWWYAGHLVTVKYLRLERYMQRFADSPVSGPPFLKAITPATDWSS